jgi:hypothetical protein
MQDGDGHEIMRFSQSAQVKQAKISGERKLHYFMAFIAW